VADDATLRALTGLRRIFGPDARARSDAQAEALVFIHQSPHKNNTKIIVLPTSSGKSALFFSLAAMATNQIVIVVVPFTALVKDLLKRGRGCGLHCEEWQGPGSVPSLPPLLIISADRAVDTEFLHFAKGLELNQQLAHIFFDECHVAFTDTLYRERLRQLWQLRYLDCPFTCLTATLMVQLEGVLRANLVIPQATLFRRSTMRKTIRYHVIDSQDRPPSIVGVELVQSLPLLPGQRGVVYVRSYGAGTSMSDILKCPFYRARSDDKGDVLSTWSSSSGGWIIATGALGTGVDIPNIVYIIHIDRPYGLTSFAQQSGRGGRGGEVSNSYVVVRLKQQQSQGGSGSGRRRAGLVSDYSVEQVDEDALDKFLLSPTCRRVVLAHYLDGSIDKTDCQSTDSVPCDRCQEGVAVEQSQGGSGRGSNSPNQQQASGADTIHYAHAITIEQDEQLRLFHQRLQQGCIFCMLMMPPEEQTPDFHTHRHCPVAPKLLCELDRYQVWRSQLRLASQGQCYRCGLPQSYCRGVEQEVACEYPHCLLPGLWFLYQVGKLWSYCQAAGFQGGIDKEQRLWQWMNETGDVGFGQVELNWLRVWRRIAEFFLVL
jgi:superfamily II DNA helicase RecQ